MRRLAWFVGLVLVLGGSAASAQSTLEILRAEDRRAPTAEDLATIRAGLRSSDAPTVAIAVRALGRLERASLIDDITPLLQHAAPAVRAEAATAIGQAAQAWKRDTPAHASIDSTQAALVARLKVETDADVRAAIEDTLGRLPYANAAQVEIAERAMLDRAAKDWFGVVQGLFRLTRFQRTLHPLSAPARAVLVDLHAKPNSPSSARVRRLALDAYLTLGPPERSVIEPLSHDADAQVRRLAMRGAAALPQHDGGAMLIAAAAGDASPLVRIEALRGLISGHADEPCATLVKAVGDRDTLVALVAIDELSKCGTSADAVSTLTRLTAARRDLPREWHRSAHALVALATASPEHAAVAFDFPFITSPTWQLRAYIANVAAILKNRAALERLADDSNDNVREAAIDALSKLYGHDADPLYIEQLTRTRAGYQALRAAALALVDTPHPDIAKPPLQAALQRLIAEGKDNSHDAREAIAKALAMPTPSPVSSQNLQKIEPELTADALHRLAHAHARIVMRGIGTFELTLHTDQAPATVVRFARLAEAGYYNGLTFHRMVPNFVIQGGSPGANEYIGDSPFMRDELGLLPHLRGSVGISTRGRDTGDAQIFVDLVDNPRLDHDYTVFADVSRGIDIVDQILEGDVIERVEIIPSGMSQYR